MINGFLLFIEGNVFYFCGLSEPFSFLSSAAILLNGIEKMFVRTG
jgi:hypothetical protein